ncbi:MAG: NAD-dependent epimerase/dehydratase family protein [Actinobacteria bacterium]|jgi:nucleoside-diphosphate-sugar epimerase|uniref:Unannotated protein n=1 Tax=freshwater metagenome TaxID=449393 RepID=A0A6J6E1G2_9ZZZZ|nr:NAD-dependent epimerase/dehydratase family protein [Actinomycetota bacterium]
MTAGIESNMRSNLHVILGNGTVGERLAKVLLLNHKQVLVLTRSKPNYELPGVSYDVANSKSTESMLAAAPKAKVIYNCVNPPYHKWKSDWPAISKAVNEFAIRSGANLVSSSNLYGYGPHNGVLTEDLPLKATWTNGEVRAEVWQEAKVLHDAGLLKVTEVRGSDYICANEQSRMGHRVVPNLLLEKPIQLLGALDQPHTWTDPDDVAKLMMVLAEDDRSWGQPWHVPSNEPKTQREVVADIANALGITNYSIRAAGPIVERILGLINPLIRELNKGSYQFHSPFVMSSKKSFEAFGLIAKPWQQVIQDLVKPYLDYVNINGMHSISKLGSERFPDLS